MASSLQETYNEQGFCIVRQVVSPAEVEALRGEVEAITKGYDRLPNSLKENILLLKDLSERQLGDLEPDTLGTVPYLIGELPAFSSTFTKAICQPRLWDAVKGVLECKTLHYHFSNVTMKPKRVGPKITWHRDYPNRYICPETSDFTRALVCLDGMSRENGCTRVVKGSHHISDEEARTGERLRDRTFSPEQVQDIVCEAGDAVLLHPKTIHGGDPNRSDKDRRNLIVQLGCADASFTTENTELFTGFGREKILAGLEGSSQNVIKLL